MPAKSSVLNKNVVGVVAWKKPEKIDYNKKDERPGPGAYQVVESKNQIAKSCHSAFRSKVQRNAHTAVGKSRGAGIGNSSAGQSTQSKSMGFLRSKRPGTTNMGSGEGMDIFDDDTSDEGPGPGAYYNPGQSCFKAPKIPEKL